ncbi:hypothetical protein [Polynucleobacter necessarius]|uniref:hypothetical protein n=1 Tax=Polynucleobacter necessarius TaxID=576610 RepID=UPI001E295C8F|nr:hypothetical protein [Polynucleobacter necessarius]
MNEAKEQFKNGDLQNTNAAIASAFKDKNTLYYLEIGEVQRLQGPLQIPNSTENLLLADRNVEQWSIDVSDKMKRSFFNTSAYVLSEGFSSTYDPKPYEISLLSQTLALNHISQGHWNDAMVEAKKMAQREKIIEQLIETKVAAVAKTQQDQQANFNTRAATSHIEDINGYPVNLLDDEETRSLKNSYQNPAAYYLSGFIHESQGEASLAAPGYRLAIELCPQVRFFKTSIAKLDSNIANQAKKNFADTLIIVDTGYMPKISPYRISQSIPVGASSRLVTLTFPVIERSTERYTPSMVQLGDKPANLELVASIDSMARRNLKDEMPGYVLRATTRALVSLAAQYAADQAAQQAANKNNRNNQNNNGTAAIIGAIASMVTGYGLQAINVTDVRHWSTLPAQTYMARMGLPIGPVQLRYVLPSGVMQTQTVNLVGGYNVVYIRMFRNRATVLTSNDPFALPQKHVVVPATLSNPVSVLPAVHETPQSAPTSTPTPAPAPVVPAEDSTSKPTGGSMDRAKETYDPPSLVDSIEQLFKQRDLV